MVLLKGKVEAKSGCPDGSDDPEHAAYGRNRLSCAPN